MIQLFISNIYLIMEIRKVPKGYSNSKILSIGVLSLLTAITILVLFIIFISTSRPSFRNFSKYAFSALCVTFCLFILYGICSFLRDDNIQAYSTKILAVGAIASVTIIGLDIPALIKSKERTLPIITFALSIAVAAIILFVSVEYFLHDPIKRKVSIENV